LDNFYATFLNIHRRNYTLYWWDFVSHFWSCYQKNIWLTFFPDTVCNVYIYTLLCMKEHCFVKNCISPTKKRWRWRKQEIVQFC